MHKGTFKGVLFDLDGTLVDSLAVTFEAFNQGILSQGGRRHTAQELLAYFGPGEGEIFAQIVGQAAAAPAYQVCRDYLDQNLGAVPLHDGVAELLEDLKSRGVPISIFTGRSWNTTELILNHHRILDRFVTVIANDHVSSPKPSPEGVLLAAKRMGFQPSELIFVGDSWVDIKAAHRAGASGVAAIWDLMADRQALEKHQPHYWAEHPRDVLSASL